VASLSEMLAIAARFIPQMLFPAFLAVERQHEPRERKMTSRKTLLAFVLIACIGSGVSLGLFGLARRMETKDIGMRFHLAAQDRASSITAHFDANLLKTRSLCAFYAASREVEREEFRKFSQPLLQRGRGIRAMEWIPCVTAEERTRFVALARKEGVEGYQILQYGAGGRVVPASSRNEYFPIYFRESTGSNNTPLGFDQASEPAQRVGLARARDTGKEFMTGRILLGQKRILLGQKRILLGQKRILLGQKTDKRFGCRVFLPFYKHGTTVNDTDGRRKALQGFVASVFDVSDTVQSALESISPQGVDIELRDKSAPVGKRLLYLHASRKQEHPDQPRNESQAGHLQGIHYVRQFDLAGRPWEILCTPTPGFVASHRTWYPWAILVTGLLFTALLGTLLNMLLGKHYSLQSLIDEANQDLKAAHADLEQVFNAAVPLSVVDKDFKVLRANDSLCSLLGVPRSRIIGRTCHEVWPGTDCGTPTCRLKEILGGMDRSEQTADKLLKDGRTMPCIITATPYRSPDGELLGIVESFVDITQLRKTENELSKASVAAEAANKAKSQFLANMSHEIRTPMTAILGFADLLLQNPGKEEIIEAVDTIKRNGEHLLKIINSILDLAKIEAGKLLPEQIRCSPRRIVAEVAALMKVRTDAKGVSLKVEHVGPTPETIIGDPTRLKQILTNLVSNAVKFTEVGSVRIVTCLVKETGDEPRMRFSVIDTGIGMTEEQMGRLFQPFSQGDSSTTRKYGGSGLGLAISKRLAETLGGDITTTSTYGEGTVINLTVTTGPLDGVRVLEHSTEDAIVSSKTVRATEKSQTELDCHILLAEDGYDNQRIVSSFLKKAGADVTVVENGQIAVEKALPSSSENGRRYDDEKGAFDVILMDMQMPVMDGYEATRRLRNAGYAKPIIALTAHAVKEDRQKCLDAGCDDYLTKPVDRGKLVEMVAKHVRAGGMRLQAIADIESVGETQIGAGGPHE